ncbi:MAG: carbamate kinase [Candidatus Aenigmarchaeota archaeon]|nr:carbamate kinase [Candidatus Aenigmarchaeota archaeon]
MLIVAALGGNALLQRGQKLSVETQFANARKAAAVLAQLAKKHQLVITHGNGPQVGNIMLQVEAALGRAYPVPLHVAVAESEGEIGYILEQSLLNELARRKLKKRIASMLTQVLVGKNDPAFQNPTKPIGPYYGKQHADALARKGFSMTKINGGYRRVVPSPKPLEILEAEAIRKLVKMGILVIAAGGGGIPVHRKGKALTGIDAVIDKDRASAVLARDVRADMLLIVTDVPCTYLDYGTKNQKAIRCMTVSQARHYIHEGHFAEGSMLPKVEAAADFVAHGGRKAVITDFASAEKALRGKAGTTMVK